MRTKHIHLDLDINFEERILSGFCLLSIEKEDDSGKKAFPQNSQCMLVVVCGPSRQNHEIPRVQKKMRRLPVVKPGKSPDLQVEWSKLNAYYSKLKEILRM